MMLSEITQAHAHVAKDSKQPEEGRAAEFTPSGEAGDDPITRNLKRAYNEVAEEPIPEHLLALLAMLDLPDPPPGGGEGGGDGANG